MGNAISVFRDIGGKRAICARGAVNNDNVQDMVFVTTGYLEMETVHAK